MAVRKRVTASQIAKKMAHRTRMAHADLTFILYLYCEEIEKALLAEKDVFLPGIGTFYIARGKQHTRNWKTGESGMMHNYPRMRFKMSNKMRANFRKTLVGRWRRENQVK